MPASVGVSVALAREIWFAAGAAGACDVEFVSPSGTFLGFQKLQVN